MPSDADLSARFPFASEYVTVDGVRLHYVDEGTGDPILFLHGNPTSAYLWRNVIPHVTPVGRALALDLAGFGKSDKPDSAYRFFDHARYVDGFIDALELTNLTVVGHDWGSALGFHYAYRHADTIKGLAFMEAFVKPRSYAEMSEGEADFFRSLRGPDGRHRVIDEHIFVEQILPEVGVQRTLTGEEMAHYRAPFEDPADREPIWRWPQEVPIDGEPPDVHEAVAAYSDWLQTTDVPKLMLYATPGAINPAPVVAWCEAHLPNLSTVHVGEGTHFIQEDHPHTIGTELAAWYRGLN